MHAQPLGNTPVLFGTCSSVRLQSSQRLVTAERASQSAAVQVRTSVQERAHCIWTGICCYRRAHAHRQLCGGSADCQACGQRQAVFELVCPSLALPWQRTDDIHDHGQAWRQRTMLSRVVMASRDLTKHRRCLVEPARALARQHGAGQLSLQQHARPRTLHAVRSHAQAAVRQSRPPASRSELEQEQWQRQTQRPRQAALPHTAGLNQSQVDAVTFGDGPCRVIAGPGSGKTRVRCTSFVTAMRTPTSSSEACLWSRCCCSDLCAPWSSKKLLIRELLTTTLWLQVLMQRIVHLVEQRQVAPEDILAITFTRKGSGEMRQRLARALPPALAERVRVGTFHSVAVSILRRCVAALLRVGLRAHVICGCALWQQWSSVQCCACMRGRAAAGVHAQVFKHKELLPPARLLQATSSNQRTTLSTEKHPALTTRASAGGSTTCRAPRSPHASPLPPTPTRRASLLRPSRSCTRLAPPPTAPAAKRWQPRTRCTVNLARMS